MYWSVQAKVIRAIKADGRATVARKCMLTQCADYDYVWLDVKSMLWLWWCKVHIRDGRRRGEECGVDAGPRRAGVPSNARWCALYFGTNLVYVSLPWWSRGKWLCNCILYIMCSTQRSRNKHDVRPRNGVLLSESGVWFKTVCLVVLASRWRQGLTLLKRVLLCARIKRSLIGISTRSFTILSIHKNLEFFRLVFKSVQPRFWIRDVTLAVCLLFGCDKSCCWCFIFCLKVSQTAEEYSKDDLSRGN